MEVEAGVVVVMLGGNMTGVSVEGTRVVLMMGGMIVEVPGGAEGVGC